jgi:hypothetical protein
MITVVNKYNEPDHIYCGRGSPLGNPFTMKGEYDRNKVCDQYQKWFDTIINDEIIIKYTHYKYCYQCDKKVAYLFSDGRCTECTRSLDDEVNPYATYE